MTDREQILSALGSVRRVEPSEADFDKQAEMGKATRVATAEPAPRVEPLPAAADRVAEASAVGDLWARFTEMLEALGGRVGTAEELSAMNGRAWIDDDAKQVLSSLQADWLSSELVDVRSPAPSPPPSRAGVGAAPIWDVEVGITTAELAIAETGSLLLAAGPGRARLASLAPPIHIVLIEQHKIVATLQEAIPYVTDRTSVFITGPSRTADIEGILVRGVHGPGELWVIAIA